MLLSYYYVPPETGMAQLINLYCIPQVRHHCAALLIALRQEHRASGCSLGQGHGEGAGVLPPTGRRCSPTPWLGRWRCSSTPLLGRQMLGRWRCSSPPLLGRQMLGRRRARMGCHHEGAKELLVCVEDVSERMQVVRSFTASITAEAIPHLSCKLWLSVE